jgi:hypothetical protein
MLLPLHLTRGQGVRWEGVKSLMCCMRSSGAACLRMCRYRHMRTPSMAATAQKAVYAHAFAIAGGMPSLDVVKEACLACQC